MKTSRSMALLMMIALSMLAACDEASVTVGDSIEDSELESFFRKYKVDGNRVVALKKRTLGDVAYLATIHGYPNNLAVCKELIAPYNEDASLSVVSGDYFCEELR